MLNQKWLDDPRISDRIKRIYSNVEDSELAADGSPEFNFELENQS